MYSLPPERERNIFSNALMRIPYSELKDKEEIGKLVFYYLHFFVVLCSHVSSRKDHFLDSYRNPNCYPTWLLSCSTVTVTGVSESDITRF